MTPAERKARSIRSFVRRRGRMTQSQKNAIDRYWPAYGIDYGKTRLELPLEYRSVTLEIGIGNGDVLIQMAAADPSGLYLGIEVHEPGIGRSLNHVHQQQLSNVRLIKHDAIEVLQNMLSVESCDRVLLFFPDPWPKKRHHKRRLVNQAFRDLVVHCLKPDGIVHIATDWQDYAEWIAAQFLGDDRYINCGDADGYAPCPDYRPQTRFERRGRRLGHSVWDLVFAKKPGSSSPASRR